jgi:hypothetical protein
MNRNGMGFFPQGLRVGLLVACLALDWLGLPASVFAQDAAEPEAIELTNPLGTTDVRVVVGYVIRAVLGVTGSIALLMIIWGGFLWLTSSGNSDRIEKGRKILTWAVLGLVVIFSAYIIVYAVLEGLTGGGTSG